MNTTQASWVTSLSQLGLPFGALATGLLADTVGRRKSALYVHSATHMIGFGLIVVANNVWFVYAGRFMTGVCMGMCNSLCFIYVTELCLTHKQVRLGQGARILHWVALAGLQECLVYVLFYNHICPREANSL